MRSRRLLYTLLVLAACGRAWAALYIVGTATEYNWSRAAMTQLSSSLYQWEGYLARSGELKFMTSSSDWGSHWGPAKALSPLTYGEAVIKLHTSGDFKFCVSRSGYYRLLADTGAGTLTATYTDGTLPETKTWPWALYPVGTATTATADCHLAEEGDDTGVYTGRLTLGEGNVAFHSRPYRSTRGTLPVEAQLSKTAKATMPKLSLTLASDRCAYLPGDVVTITSSTAIPTDTRVRYRHLGDVVADTAITTKKWTWRVPDDDFRGYMAEVYQTDGEKDVILGTIAIDVSSDYTHFPRFGFVASFGSDKTIATIRNEMNWLLRCHINAVQFQDWHYCHDQPLAGTSLKPLSSYKDIANRTIYLSAVKNYIKWQHELGMKSFFYNLCYGVLDGYASRGVKDEWLAYKDQSHTNKDYHDLPDSWKSDIYLADPGNSDWQQYLADRTDDVYAALDFDGYQIDQLGGRGTLYDYNGNVINMTDGYASFIQTMKRRQPEKGLIMNAVSEYGTDAIAGTGKMDALYNEVWGNHAYDALTHSEAQFAHLKTIIDNNRSANATLRTIFAAYMDYCCSDVSFNTPGVVMADAVMMALGGSHLELGGDHMLSREYFPNSTVKMNTELEDWMTRYYDFMTAYENLLRGDWTEKTTATVRATGVTINKWSPVNGQITQLTRTVEGRHVVHLLNFCTQPSDDITDPNYLLCWHDRDGLRPWPVEHEDLAVTISGLGTLGKVRRVWVASPDYMGGAMQEIQDYRVSGSILKLTVPALQFWTMIVIEPESTTMTDNVMYGPAVADCELVSSGIYRLQSTKQETDVFTLPAAGTFQARLSLPENSLTLEREGTDEVIRIPYRAEAGTAWTLSGRRATSTDRGIRIQDGKALLKP